MTPSPHCSRRRLLLGVGAAIGTSMAPAIGMAATRLPAPQPPMPHAAAEGLPTMRLVHLHTHEKLDLMLVPAPAERPDLLAAVDRFLRDHYSGAQGRMDPGLLEQLRGLQALLAGRTIE